MKKRAREVRVEESKDAPFEKTPLWIARNRIKSDEDWTLDTIFPEVMGEDRTSKLKDLATAQAVGAISHQRMAEQMAKELGFDDYDYDAEIEAIEEEQKTLPSSLLGIADNIGTSVLGPAAGKKGMGGGGTLNIGAPAPGIAAEEEGPLYSRKYEFSGGSTRRDDLSGTATARFRKLQKAPHGEG